MLTNDFDDHIAVSDQVALNEKCCAFLDCDIINGVVWDRENRQTRIIPHSELYLKRIEYEYQDGPGFVFDVFDNVTDRIRVINKLANKKTPFQEWWLCYESWETFYEILWREITGTSSPYFNRITKQALEASGSDSSVKEVEQLRSVAL